jgi:hypothetical protein
MKEINLIEDKYENKGELTLENARELLGDNTISDERLEKIITGIKAFCKVAYELYLNEQEKIKQLEQETDNIIPLHSESTEQIKEAA